MKFSWCSFGKKVKINQQNLNIWNVDSAWTLQLLLARHERHQSCSAAAVKYPTPPPPWTFEWCAIRVLAIKLHETCNKIVTKFTNCTGFVLEKASFDPNYGYNRLHGIIVRLKHYCHISILRGSCYITQFLKKNIFSLIIFINFVDEAYH